MPFVSLFLGLVSLEIHGKGLNDGYESAVKDDLFRRSSEWNNKIQIVCEWLEEITKNMNSVVFNGFAVSQI